MKDKESLKILKILVKITEVNFIFIFFIINRDKFCQFKENQRFKTGRQFQKLLKHQSINS